MRHERMKFFAHGAMLMLLLLLPLSSQAQNAAQGGGARVRTVAVANACAELASSPSSLVLMPEGLALLRLKRELESAALTLERQPVRTNDVQRITQVQRGVDSLMRVMVRVQRDDGMPMPFGPPMPSGPMGATVSASTTRRGDSVRVTVNGSPFDGRMFFEMTDSARGMMPQVAMIIRSLQPQVAAVSEAAEARLAEMRPAMGVAPIMGYVGVSLSGAQLRAVTPGGVMTSHCEYPLVESVDAGSPAERAGITAGDTLVAYNGRDVLQIAVNYPELFVAGQQVRVRVRRSGRARELPVNVVPRAEERAMVFVRSLSGEGASPTPGRIFVSQASVPPLPTAGVSGRPGLPGAQLTTFAGAQFTTIDDDFAQTIGLDAGVLVLRAPMGTPAAEAGLRGGEIVRAVNGTPVRDAGALLRMLVNSGHEARLLVQSRANGERVLTLRLK